MLMRRIKPFLLIATAYCLLLIEGCNSSKTSNKPITKTQLPERFLVVLGIAQDAGYPQAGCQKECCQAYWRGLEKKEMVVCLGLVDSKTQQNWMFETTPDFKYQLQSLESGFAATPDSLPAGIFITHAHTGHYTGLMQLGREAMNASNMPVWVMPRLDSFLRNNGPWRQLVSLHNIKLSLLKADSTIRLNESLSVTPIVVPHRDEFSETVGFSIESNKKKVLFIPDINKWEKWDRNIITEISKVDLALLDGTFYKNGELSGRDMSEIPHPFVEESMKRFDSLPAKERSKIVFIHFNHTNPLLKKTSGEKDKAKAAGFGVAEEGMIIEL